MTKVQNIPDSDHVLRFLRVRDQFRDLESDELRGVHAAAFEPRPCDKGALSVTWIEYFQGTSSTPLIKAIAAFRKAWGRSLQKPLFAKANVGSLKAVCKHAGKPVRVLHEPTTNNRGHAAIRRLQDAESVVFDQLAHDTFAELLDEHGSKVCVKPAMGYDPSL